MQKAGQRRVAKTGTPLSVVLGHSSSLFLNRPRRTRQSSVFANDGIAAVISNRTLRSCAEYGHYVR